MAVYMMGETTEQTPLCTLRDAPHVEFVNESMSDEMFVPPEEDIYYPLLKQFSEE